MHKHLVPAALFALTLSAWQLSAAEPDPAMQRARRELQMMDDIYKNAIVLVTTHYVQESSDLPAGAAFKKLFAVAKAKGYHEVRLLDATGEPLEDVNAPRDAFEKRAIAELLQGKPQVEEIIKRDGRRYLRAATPIPVVMEKCVMCHENYAGVPKGRPIGALGYIIPIDLPPAK